jgi:hypothetical protein
MNGSVVSGLPELEELSKVLKSRAFSKSPRVCSMLEFIVTHSLDRRHGELTEQQIGIQVFGRPPGYNSSDDTIVRGTARHLRQRLDLYYSSEGAEDPLRIEIPRGAYVATFDQPLPKAPVPGAGANVAPAHTTAEPHHAPQFHLAAWLTTAVVLLAVALVWLSSAYIQLRRESLDVPALAGPQPLWHALFTPDRKTLIVPGDASLDAFIAWEQRPVTLEQFATQLYHQQATVTRPPTHMDVPLSARSVTPMADLVLVSTLVRAPEHMGEPGLENSIEVRYARDMAISDTHDNNLILIGSETFNPWVTLYQPEMDFVAHWDFTKDIYRVENKAPRAGELPVYIYDRRAGQDQKAITHIALLSNSQGIGRVLVIEGTSMGTTYGAVNFLTHESVWEPVIRQATDRSGRLHDFEVLLSGDFIHGGVGNTKVLAVHVH